MATFSYDVNNGSLNDSTLSMNFNRCRAYKQILDTLIKLKKVHFSQYKVLEPACGGGDKLRFLSEWGIKPENCYGIELSESGVEKCRYLSPAAMNFQVGDAFNLPYEDEYFDILICSGLFGCYQSDDDVKKLAAEIDRVLKYTGVFIVCDINENFAATYANNPVIQAKNLRGYDSKNGQLEALLSDYFMNVTIAPLFPCDLYTNNEGKPLDITEFPAVDYQIDNGNVACSYTLWSFIKK